LNAVGNTPHRFRDGGANGCAIAIWCPSAAVARLAVSQHKCSRQHRTPVVAISRLRPWRENG
jgi:hypothetical protein